MRKALARLVALLDRHSQPAVRAVRERLLACRRQAVPLGSEPRQELLLLGRKTRPGDRSRGSGTRRRRLLRNGGRLPRKRGRRRKKAREGPPAPSLTH